MSGPLSITGTIFVLIGLGYALARTGVLDRAAVGALSRFVVTVALPALIIRALGTREFSEIADATYLSAYLVGSLATLIGGYAAGRRLLGLDSSGSTFAAMGMACTNSGYIGYPILAITMPGISGTALALNMLVENLVLIPLVLIMAERAAAGSEGGRTLKRRIGRRLATNPILIAIVIGAALSLLPGSLPALIERPVSLLADSASAIALMVIGGSLVGTRVRRGDFTLALVVGGKLLLHPLAVGCAFVLLGLIGAVTSPEMAQAAILMAAMPAMGIYPLLAAQYGEGEFASVAMLAMVAGAFFTVSTLLWLMQP